MQRLFAAVLAVACVVGSTPSFARDANPYSYTAPQGYSGYAYAPGYGHAPGYGARSPPVIPPSARGTAARPALGTVLALPPDLAGFAPGI
jgi:hypothetical protein